ncbi:MAG: tetratricopeptide repeat protein, partial [Bdellovibrionales bacterium]|nr:tetratricopeptide repeat protein [Bdellovibrionales bacterium]
FFETIGRPDAIQFLREGFSMLPEQPSSAVPVMLNVLVVSLVAFTLAFFMTCLVQVIVNSTAIIKRFNRRLPVRVRGLLGPPMLILLLGVPIFGGLLVVIGCWALILSRCVRSCRWLGFSAGALALAWWFCVPVLQAGGGQSREPINRTLENVRNQSYGEFDETIIMAGLQTRNVDPLVAFTLGLQYLRGGKVDMAEKIFAKVRHAQDVARAEVFRQASLINLGVIEYQRSNLEEALRLFKAAETQGAKGYELYHNMAVVYLAQVDTVKHREYYDKAREYAHELEGSVDESTVLTVNVPLSEYYYRFLKPVAGRSPEQAAKDKAAEMQLFESLMLGGSPTVLFIWALVLIGLGAVNFRSIGASRYLLADGAQSPSLAWALVPGGYFGAGRHPGTCIIVLGIFMLVVMLAMGEPNIHYEVVAGELPLQEILFFVAAGIVILQGGLSLIVAAAANSAKRRAHKSRA